METSSRDPEGELASRSSLRHPCEETGSEHRLRRPRAAPPQAPQQGAERAGAEPGSGGELLGNIPEGRRVGSVKERLEESGGASQATEELGVGKEAGGGERRPDGADEKRAGMAASDDLAERRETGPATDLEASAQNGSDPTEPPSTEEVGEMSYLHGLRPFPADKRRDREGGRERPRGAGAESLADGQIVLKADREAAAGPVGEPSGDLARDCQIGGERPLQPQREAGGRSEPSDRGHPETKDEPGTPRSPGPGIPRGGLRQDDTGDMAGSERPALRGSLGGHRRTRTPPDGLLLISHLV